jgi:hypothetical protein
MTVPPLGRVTRKWRRRNGEEASRRFDWLQSSLVFINTCFAVSFTGVFILLESCFDSETPIEVLARIAWAALATYLIIIVWRQYTMYYIPLQFHSQTLESVGAEVKTFAITLVLGLIGISAARRPAAAPLLLIVLILLNLLKLREMRDTLRPKWPHTMLAIEELRHLARKLRLNLFLLMAVLIILFAYSHYWSQSTASLIAALSAFVLHPVVQPLYRNMYLSHQPSPEQYNETIAQAWSPAKRYTNYVK